MRLIAGFTRQWHLSNGLAVVWLSLILKYFTIDPKALNIEVLSQAVERIFGAGFSSKISYLILLAYAYIV